MAGGSRHKAHRSHKHRDRLDSEDEGNYRDRKQRVEEQESARVSRVSDHEKRKSLAKDGIGTSNGDTSGDHGKKRKDRGDDVDIGGDRWNGGGDHDPGGKELKKEGAEAVDLEKSSKLRSSGVESKGKSSSSRKREGSSERNEEKRRPEKESSRRESSSSQYKDGKEKEKEREREREKERERDKESERGSEKDKKVLDSRHERSDEGASKRGERSAKEVEISAELQDEMRSHEVEKELDKWVKRRDGSGDRDRAYDGREGDDRQISRDVRSKNESYKDGRCKEKYRDELDRDQRRRDDKHRDERSSRTHINERSDSKHYRDESRVSESRDKQTKYQDSDRDGSRHGGDDYSTKLKDNKARKRPEENEEQNDMKPRSAKEPHEDSERNGSSSIKYDSRSDKTRLEHSYSDKADASLSNSRTKNSPNTSAYAIKDQNRHNSRQSESTHRESLSGRAGTVSRDHMTASGGRERMSESRSSEKAKLKDNIRSDVLTPRSDSRASPNQRTEKSPSTIERRSERRGDREREYQEKPNEDDITQEHSKRDHVSIGPSNRSAPFLGNSPGHLPPPPSRFRANSPSVLGSYEDETRIQSMERKTNNRYKKDASIGRGPGTPWKSGPGPSWPPPSPVANGFMHGPVAGFRSSVPQFPAPALYGVRPAMDMSNRYPGPARSYGWHNPVDDIPPHLQAWDGNNGVFGDESQIYGRQEWDQNRLLMSGRGWEMSSENMWSGQNGNVNMDFTGPTHKEQESWVGQSGHHSRDERTRSEQPIADANAIKLPNDASPAKQAVGASSKSVAEKTPELSKMPSVSETPEAQSDDSVLLKYLSKLDISPNLAHPELYKQCMSLLEASDRNVTCNVASQGRWKNNLESILVSKDGQFAHCSLFPKPSEATFQRAMTLYRKQKESLASPLLHAQNNHPESDANSKNKIAAAEQVPANANSGDFMEEDNKTAADVECDVEEKRFDQPNHSKAKLIDNSCNADAVKGFDKITDGVVFVEGSEESEAINPECRVNISRIHLSPESTH